MGVGASCPPVPPTCLRSVLREAEMGGGRRKESGRENGREEEKEEGGNIGQKIDMISDHPPFLCRHGGQSSRHGHCGGRGQGGNQLHNLHCLSWA